MINKIDQTKLNALSAKILHRKNKWKYDALNNLILILTIVVPILFIIALYVSKGTNYETAINNISFALSVILISVSVLSLILKISDKTTTHIIGMRNNIYIANECDQVANLSDSQLSWFFKYVSEMDNQDNDTFSNVSEKTRQETYRAALKEASPGNPDVFCPICKASPWKFKKGNCQLCGNTPA